LDLKEKLEGTIYKILITEFTFSILLIVRILSFSNLSFNSLKTLSYFVSQIGLKKSDLIQSDCIRAKC